MSKVSLSFEQQSSETLFVEHNFYLLLNTRIWSFGKEGSKLGFQSYLDYDSVCFEFLLVYVCCDYDCLFCLMIFCVYQPNMSKSFSRGDTYMPEA